MLSSKEIKKAVWDCRTDKSPGPDGFSFGFYRHFWKLIENDVFEAVQQFFTNEEIPKGCNSSFIALILKIPDANLVKDFRPISLIGSMYKIIAKILANRLVGVLGDIVDEVQSAFIADRQILDGPFILNEVLQWSIIINGSPTKEFQFFKGLNQGDPLSPFLFLLIMESLHLSFQRVVDAGLFKGLELSSSLIISHMFYADDAIFIGQWCDGNINTLVRMIVGGSMSRVSRWNEVVERVKNRLSKWKMKALSVGGRLTLLKSVLGSILIFYMSVFRAPLSVLRVLESIWSHFFNGHELKSKKSTWVKWNNVLASKKKGGLGVSSLYALNRGFMCKWLWRFYNHNTSLWARVIKAIHRDDESMGKHVKAGTQSCWMAIVNEITVLKKHGINIFDFMRIKLGNGDKIAFWEDNWIGDHVLKDLYPRIYAFETCKSVIVGSKLAHASLDSSFRRKPRGRAEQVQYEALSSQVYDVTLAPMSDRWTWSLESSGEFFVASIRKVIDDKRLLVVTTKTRWIKYVPIKVNVHAWKVRIDSHPTRFNISCRGIDIESIMCLICVNGAESVNHLFFTCSLVR
uniref:RNA-directed DNA polymerase, eukaryota, reverse transcriptase zinc-binding domain protein n=1 Tax=Tanacetum cinerariifolium TaxID=118510 RepID=A0A6L2LY72_TANCI|nr:RNA-directed DNA polymerase, eukaryota, reverse transcriptase zinc-binding domain protein [Tanacetum cinerariifolium]